MSNTRGSPRNSYRYRQLRTAVVATWRAQDRRCWHDNQPIDWGAPPGDPEACEVDHVLPVSTHPDQALDVSLWRPAHRRCNGARGNRPPPAGLGELSGDW
jgi:5-methylcytosine-specific restriction endonuclease McrA